jgi:glutamine amidotransferase
VCCRAIEHLKFKYTLVRKPEDLNEIDKLIIPGVGAFKVAMEQLDALGLVNPIQEASDRGLHIMGICLGMQLLMNRSSEFGETEGMGLIKGCVKLIPSLGVRGVKHKVPHIGWNELIVRDKHNKLVGGLNKDDSVYFVHSYMVMLENEQDLISYSDYDGIKIPAIIGHKNILGCQFHPEKSGELGLGILRRFISGW